MGWRFSSNRPNGLHEITYLMSENNSTVTPEIHRRLAASLFNHVWTLLETPERAPELDDEMIHAAHASRYHWGHVGEPVNFARGEWQIARVYAVLKRPEPARYHAQRCLDICLANGIGDFDLAYAYEALARASAVAGDDEARNNYAELAHEAGKSIIDDDDRQLFESDMATIPPN